MSVMRGFQERMRNEGRVIAKMPRASAKAAPGKLAGAQLEALVSASLTEDLAALKGLNSVERKVAMKRDTLIPKYGDYARRLKDAGKTAHELLGYWLVWLFDVGMMAEAFEHALWCLKNGVALPARFQSDIRFFIAAQVLEWAEAEFAAGRSPEPYFSALFTETLMEPEKWNLPDDLRARFFRLRGLMAEKDGDLALAEADLQKALDLGAKVKTALAGVRKKIHDESAAAQREGGAGGDDSPAGAPREAGVGLSPAPGENG